MSPHSPLPVTDCNCRCARHAWCLTLSAQAAGAAAADSNNFQRCWCQTTAVIVSALLSVLQGASASLWRRYMPNAEIWFAEYDSSCLLKHMPNLTALNLKAVSGDQADNATLARWLKETGGNFDVIIVRRALHLTACHVCSCRWCWCAGMASTFNVGMACHTVQRGAFRLW